MRNLIDDFHNKVLIELDLKYFPGQEYYRDNDNCSNVHYQTELFSNGITPFETYIKRVAKLCNDTKENILQIVTKYIK